MSPAQVQVLFRAYRDRPAIVVVREIRGGIPIICRPELVDAIEAGTLSVMPIGAHLEDLYELTEEAAAAVRAGHPIDWDQLHPARL